MPEKCPWCGATWKRDGWECESVHATFTLNDEHWQSDHCRIICLERRVEKLKAALQKIINERDYTAPEKAVRIAEDALECKKYPQEGTP
jgi:hypothetical protein